MRPLNILKDMQEKVEELIQNSPAKDIQNHVKSLMNNTFNRLDLITREEFDIQKEVLQTTRNKLEELEKKLDYINSKLNPIASQNVSTIDSVADLNSSNFSNNS